MDADLKVSLQALATAITALTPDERRRLLRRLRTAGVVGADEVLTDRNRLQVAPALGLRRRALRRPVAPVQVEPTPPTPPSSPTPPPSVPETGPVAPVPEEPYRSAVSGKVVVGAPDAPAPDDPHAMSPLPGQAPEQPIGVIFDGGSRGNPGQGYGSYALRWPGQAQQIVQLRFGDRVTNNEAEYDTLIAALEAILKRLQEHGATPATARIDVRGDSLLVINQVKGKWEAKEPRLQSRRDRVRGLLRQFGGWQLTHHDREQSVKTLGH